MSHRIFFGGTFDPPHLGHDQMLRALAVDPWVDAIHFVPTGVNPFKAESSHVPELGAREMWIRSWWDSFVRDCVACGKELVFEDLELKRAPEPSFTADTIKTIQKRFPGDEWSLVVGGDIPESFHKWKDVRELFSQLKSVWIFRRGQQLDPLELLDGSLRGICPFRIMAQKIHWVSSTELRKAVLEGDSEFLRKALPPSLHPVFFDS